MYFHMSCFTTYREIKHKTKNENKSLAWPPNLRYRQLNVLECTAWSIPSRSQNCCSLLLILKQFCQSSTRVSDLMSQNEKNASSQLFKPTWIDTVNTLDLKNAGQTKRELCYLDQLPDFLNNLIFSLAFSCVIHHTTCVVKEPFCRRSLII